MKKSSGLKLHKKNNTKIKINTIKIMRVKIVIKNKSRGNNKF